MVGDSGLKGPVPLLQPLVHLTNGPPEYFEDDYSSYRPRNMVLRETGKNTQQFEERLE
jgi:hypothetical protein